MEAEPTILDCPAYLDSCGAARCGLPADVEYWYAMTSTDGPLDSAKIRCPAGHVFSGPVESLTRVSDRQPAPALPAAASRA
jgi:hypothetical protein